MKNKYTLLYNEIKEIASLYRESKVKEARKCYEQYIGLIVLDENISELEKNVLLEYWEELKNDRD